MKGLHKMDIKHNETQESRNLTKEFLLSFAYNYKGLYITQT